MEERLSQYWLKDFVPIIGRFLRRGYRGEGEGTFRVFGFWRRVSKIFCFFLLREWEFLWVALAWRDLEGWDWDWGFTDSSIWVIIPDGALKVNTVLFLDLPFIISFLYGVRRV